MLFVSAEQKSEATVKRKMGNQVNNEDVFRIVTVLYSVHKVCSIAAVLLL